MTTTIIWNNKNKNYYSIEYFSLKSQIDTNIMRGTVILLLNDKPALITYVIITDANWRTRSVKIKQQASSNPTRRIYLEIDQDQNWRKNIKERSSDSPVVLDLASGLNDVDLQVTPSTNTLPINRLDLKEGESRKIDVLWISFPDLTLGRQQQKYSKIDERFYIFEIPSIDFVAKLEVDTFGLIVNYDNLWRRLS
jgi:hypothetical protein